MQFHDELNCPQCECDFQTASELLQHFATHAIEEFVTNPDVDTDEQKQLLYKKTIPDLHPIVKKVNNKRSVENVNPLTFCEVSIDDGKLGFESKKSRRYECFYCEKNFGWSTDLKRHILTHTGEKPFKCNFCNLSYTRKFILHKHIDKCHGKPKIPDLKPINTGFSMELEKYK